MLKHRFYPSIYLHISFIQKKIDCWFHLNFSVELHVKQLVQTVTIRVIRARSKRYDPRKLVESFNLHTSIYFVQHSINSAPTRWKSGEAIRRGKIWQKALTGLWCECCLHERMFLSLTHWWIQPVTIRSRWDLYMVSRLGTLQIPMRRVFNQLPCRVYRNEKLKKRASRGRVAKGRLQVFGRVGKSLDRDPSTRPHVRDIPLEWVSI